MNTSLSNLLTARRSARRQASFRRILSKNAFGGPLEQAVRWHLFYDGARVISMVAQGTGKLLTWSPGPAMEPEELGKSDRLQALAKEVTRGEVPPAIVLAVMHAESRGNPQARRT